MGRRVSQSCLKRYRDTVLTALLESRGSWLSLGDLTIRVGDRISDHYIRVALEELMGSGRCERRVYRDPVYGRRRVEYRYVPFRPVPLLGESA